MSDLQEALLKAGLADDKKLEQERRRRRKQRKSLDPSEIRRKHADKEIQRKQYELELRNDERKRQQIIQDELHEDRIARIIDSGRVEIPSGNRRFFFVDKEGNIPFIETDDNVIKGLRRGELAIVEEGKGNSSTVILVNRDTALLLKEYDSERIRFWNT